MNRKGIHTAVILLIFITLTAALWGCGRNSAASEPEASVANKPVSSAEPVSTPEADAAPEAETSAPEEFSDAQLLSAIKAYCIQRNPDLENIANAGEYPVYWEIASSDEEETVVLFRSYTGSQTRYYIDRSTGQTGVTEFMPGITDEEQRTDESFNVKDYFNGE